MKLFSVKQNQYFDSNFITEVFDDYLVYTEENKLSPEYTKKEFNDHVENDTLPSDFVDQMLYHAEMNGKIIEDYIVLN